MTSFTSKRITRTHVLTLSASVEEVFPLFDPINEKKWAAHWDFETVYPETGEVDEDFVFKTNHQGKSEKIWIITKFDTEQFQIEYLIVEPDAKVGKLQIHCVREGDGMTKAVVTHTYTTLTDNGNHYVEHVTEEQYRQRMDHWENAINFYLETGNTLKEHL